MTDVKLEPCPTPWCGNDEAGAAPVFADRGIEGDHYQVICPQCGVRGPLKLTRAEAIAAWNQRHQPQREAVELAAWAPTSFRGEGYVYRRKEDAETLTGPATPLYAIRALKTTPAPAVSTEEIAGVIDAALACTPTVREGQIIYDCGNPWEMLRAILSRIRGEGE